MLDVLCIPLICSLVCAAGTLQAIGQQSTLPEAVEAVVEQQKKGSKQTLNLFGDMVEGSLSVTDQERPPFSRLLEAACDHADRTGVPNIFESQALQAIVQCVNIYASPLVGLSLCWSQVSECTENR